MNKAILFLINGFGIEDKESYPIYSADIVPTLDKLTKEGRFSSLTTEAHDIKTGYRYLNTATMSPLETKYIDRLVYKNQLGTKLTELENALDKNNNNTHIFLYLNPSVSHTTFLDFMNKIAPKAHKKLYLHFILEGNDLDDYKFIEKFINTIRFHLPKNVTFGLFLGNTIFEEEKNKEELKSLMRALSGKATGVQWKDIKARINTLIIGKTIPKDVKPVFIDEIFKIESNELIFFYNYYTYNCSKFINMLNNPSEYLSYDIIERTGTIYYSLFPIDDLVKPILNNIVSGISLSKYMYNMQKRALVFCKKDDFDTINYLNNGFVKAKSNYIDYEFTDDGILSNEEKMSQILNDSNYNLIIINTSIDFIDTEKGIKEELTKIDSHIALLLKVMQFKIPMIISSLYGIRKYINLENGKTDEVNFSKKVPVILYNSKYNNSSYKMAKDDIYLLFSTSLMLIDPSVGLNAVAKSKPTIQGFVKENKEFLNELKDDFGDFKKDFDDLRGDISNIKENFKEDINNLKNNFKDFN